MSGKLKLILFIITLVLLTTGAGVHAQLKDSDSDGITDEAEAKIYHTDSTKFDTDGDGFSDGAEVLNKTDPLSSTNSPILNITKQTVKFVSNNDPIAWYISRISGITAFILLTFVVAFGLLQTSKALVKYRFMTVATALETHRTIAWAGIIAVIIHFSSLFFDDVLKLTPREALIPFQVVRNFKTVQGFTFGIPISLGISGLYCILLLIITSEIRGKIVSMKAWRTIHYISFAGYIMFVIHGFVTGSDSKEAWMRALYIGSLILNVGLLLGRIFKKKLFYPKRPKPVVAPTTATIDTSSATIPQVEKQNIINQGQSSVQPIPTPLV